VQQLCDDFAAEADDLDRIVASPDVDWSTSTPAPGWSVADQISHLWFFDQRAAMALADPDAFRADAEALMIAMVESGGTDMSAAAGRSMTSASLLDAWRLDRTRLIELARDVDPSTRVPWYGPAMGARSFVTARVMETWAHGQDIADALAVTREPADRLRHVAHIGVGARTFSYAVHARPMPDAAIRVELRGPSGDVWTWGPDDAVDRVAATRSSSASWSRSGATSTTRRSPSTATQRRSGCRSPSRSPAHLAQDAPPASSPDRRGHTASFDSLRPFPKAMLVRRLGALGPARRPLLCAIAAATLDC